jgi:hypothetical protein
MLNLESDEVFISSVEQNVFRMCSFILIVTGSDTSKFENLGSLANRIEDSNRPKPLVSDTGLLLQKRAPKTKLIM